MIEKPTIDLVKSDLGQQNRATLKRIWRSLINLKNYAVPETLEDLDKVGPFPIFELSNKDFVDDKIISKSSFKLEFYPKAEKNRLSFREYTDVLYRLNSLKRFVSYDSIYHSVVKEVKKEFIKKHQSKESEFDESLDEIIKNILSQVKFYEFYNIINGIDFIDIISIRIGDVEFFKYQDNSVLPCKVKGDELKFFESFRDEICMRCKVLGEHRQAQAIAIRKFNWLFTSMCG